MRGSLSQAEVQSVAAVSVLLIAKFLLTHSLPLVLDLWEATILDFEVEEQRMSFLFWADISNFLVIVNW